MTCEEWREAISARLDGEQLGIDATRLDSHLAGCAACRTFAAATAASHRRQRIAPAPDIPDLARPVAGAVAAADRAGRWSIVRALLTVVAVEIIVFSLPALVLGDGRDTSAHAARHLGAFTAAYGVGLLVVAIRPARARTMLPVAAVLAGALVITAVVDLVEGRVPLLGETLHVPEVLSVVFVWLLAVRPPRRPATATGLRDVSEPRSSSRPSPQRSR